MSLQTVLHTYEEESAEYQDSRRKLEKNLISIQKESESGISVLRLNVLLAKYGKLKHDEERVGIELLIRSTMRSEMMRDDERRVT